MAQETNETPAPKPTAQPADEAQTAESQAAEAQAPDAQAQETQQAEAPDAQAQADESQADEETQTEPKLPANKVTIEDGEESTKQVSIEIDRQRIDAKYNEMYGELEVNALVPGFRKGHAPRRLVEKRFGKEVSEDVRNALVSESLSEAIKDYDIQMLEEPEIDLDEIKIPDAGNLTFSVKIEVAPEFDLPNYKGIAITRRSAEVTPDRLQEAINQFLSSRGALVPVEGPIQAGDLVVVDAAFEGEGITKQTREGLSLRVAPAAIEGIPLEELADKLAGLKAGESATLESTVPQGHPTEEWRGKAVQFELTVREVKRLEVPELTDALAEELGFESAQQFREFVRGRLEDRLATEVRQDMRDQVARTLLDNSELDVPPGVAARQTARVLRRRYVDLLYRGVPREQIDQNLELLQAQADKQAREDLKLSFILAKIAEAEKIEVQEDEVNARVAQMAASQNRRPERLRTELANDGTLEQVEVQIREERTIDKVLELAVIAEADEDDADQAKPDETAKAKAKPKPRSKKSKSAKAKDSKPAKAEAKAQESEADDDKADSAKPAKAKGDKAKGKASKSEGDSGQPDEAQGEGE